MPKFNSWKQQSELAGQFFQSELALFTSSCLLLMMWWVGWLCDRQTVDLSGSTWLLILQQAGLDSFARWSQNSRATREQASINKTFQVSFCVILVNVPLARRSQTANPDSRRWRNKLNLLWEDLQHQISRVWMQRKEDFDHFDSLSQGGCRIFFNEDFRKKRLFFSMSTCLEMKQMRGFCFQGLVTLNSLVIWKI